MKRREFDIFDDFFKDPFFQHPIGPKEREMMRTDIKENSDNYELIIDLPGYDKDNIKISVDNGYLTINASKKEEHEAKDKDSFVRRERFVGECSRSFYIGDSIDTEDIKANFKNGTLNLVVPKEIEKEIPEKKYVQIDD